MQGTANCLVNMVILSLGLFWEPYWCFILSRHHCYRDTLLLPLLFSIFLSSVHSVHWSCTRFIHIKAHCWVLYDWAVLLHVGGAVECASSAPVCQGGFRDSSVNNRLAIKAVFWRLGVGAHVCGHDCVLKCHSHAWLFYYPDLWVSQHHSASQLIYTV